MNKEIYNLIVKFLKRKTWNIDGYKYIFFDVNVIEDELNRHFLSFDIECILPEKGQSFITSKFYSDTRKILENVYSIFSVHISYTAKYYIDHKSVEADIFISEKTYRELNLKLSQLKQSFPIQLNYGDEKYELTFGTNYHISNKDSISIEDETIYIEADISIFDLRINQTPVYVDDKYFSFSSKLVDLSIKESGLNHYVLNIIDDILIEDLELDTEDLSEVSTMVFLNLESMDGKKVTDSFDMDIITSLDSSGRVIPKLFKLKF